MNRFNRIVHKMYFFYSLRNTPYGGGIALRISYLLHRIIRLYYHCDIPNSINLNGVYFCHKGFNVVINNNSTIGEGTYIQHGVTIGTRDDKKETQGPIIGKNCYIGAKATIIGNIKIGDNCKIGAGAVVINDIPEGSTAVGVPAIIKK